MPGDRRPWASSACRSQAMGTIGADCSWAARATTPGPPPQPHGRVRLGLEVSRFLHSWVGGLACAESPRGAEFWGPLAPFSFSTYLNKKKSMLPDREASLIKKEHCRLKCIPTLPTSDPHPERNLTRKGGQASWCPSLGPLGISQSPGKQASIALRGHAPHRRPSLIAPRGALTRLREGNQVLEQMAAPSAHEFGGGGLLALS